MRLGSSHVKRSSHTRCNARSFLPRAVILPCRDKLCHDSSAAEAPRYNPCSSQRPGIAPCAQQPQPLAASSHAYSQDMRCATHPHCVGAAHQSNNSTRPTSSAQHTGARRDASAGTGTGSRQEEEEGRSTFGDLVAGSTPSPRTTSSSVSLASTASSSRHGHMSRCFRCVPPPLRRQPPPPLPIKPPDALENRS